MLSKFFLDRPVFAWVISIVMMVLGGLAIRNLPISQYPPIAPPSIAIDAYYPGASAETVEKYFSACARPVSMASMVSSRSADSGWRSDS